MSYYTTRGKTHLISPSDNSKVVCGLSLEDINKATTFKDACTCRRCKGEMGMAVRKKPIT
jgi:hypothetical protein